MPPPTRQLTKNDLRMAEIQASAVRFAEIMGIIRLVVVGGIILGCVYLIFEGLQPILTREPDAIQAFASVVRALSLSQIVLALVSLGTTSAWLLERRGKKRALKEKAKFQRQIEQGDTYRSSSENPI